MLVMTYRNMPRLGIVPLIGVTDLSAVGNSALPIMQDPEIRYNGQVVALILAANAGAGGPCRLADRNRL